MSYSKAYFKADGKRDSVQNMDSYLAQNFPELSDLHLTQADTPILPQFPDHVKQTPPMTYEAVNQQTMRGNPFMQSGMTASQARPFCYTGSAGFYGSP